MKFINILNILTIKRNLLFVGIYLFLSSLMSCLNEEEQIEINYKPVTIVTSSPSSITYNSVVVGGKISAPQERKVSRGVCWNTMPNPEIATSQKTTDGTGIGAYNSTISGLAANTTYYIRAYAISTLSTVYGNQISVKTAMPIMATVSTNIVTTITSTSAICGGNVTEDGGSSIYSKGICWAITPSPTITNSKTSNGSDIGTFSSMITGLSAGVTYYVRAYVTNSKGTAYGNEVPFKSLSGAPTITTINVTSITSTNAISGGNITNDGGASISSRGVCWSTTSTPTILNSKTNNGADIGSFSSAITDLSSNTTYYVRAYATNNVGTAYGSVQSFKTTAILLPTISTNTATSITTSGGSSGGNISSDGGSTVTSRGVCWSNTTSAPTISNSITSNGSGTGLFTSSITGLSANTTYYVRAYATNSVGTAYGTQINFRTSSISLPAISTISAYSITTSSAISGGSITSDGGASITSKGVCWSTASSPTTSSNKTIDGTGTGSFTSSITGLASNTTYYVRAYAINSAGTSYSSQISFSTLRVQLPSISTSSASSITTSNANSGGSITSDGGASITSKGVCWSSTTSSPTTSNSKTINGSGIGSFTSSITGLSPNTTYYVRAYATNNAGTAYGTIISFRTLSINLPTISTNSASSITTSSAISGGSITSDGGASIISKGVCWSSATSSPTTSNSKTIDGNGTGSFISSITGLSPNTTYYVRMYATNSAGTAYGSVRSFTTISIAIGQSYQGGIIFYVDGTGLHGLICATSDQSTGIRWHNGSYITVGAYRTTIGSGNANTTQIVTLLGTGSYAARICYDLVLNGYSDWFLPSSSELSLMYNNLKLPNMGSFTNLGYWSSSEYSSSYSYFVSFSSGLSYTSTKSNTFCVRAIRTF